MTREELKNKYSAFITEISEILGLGKPVDILKLCATTDLFFQPLEKRITELEKENEELQQKWLNESYEKAKLVEKWKHNGENIIQECKDIEGAKTYYEHQLTKAKELLNEFMRISKASDEDFEHDYSELIGEAEQFLKDSEGK